MYRKQATQAGIFSLELLKAQKRWRNFQLGVLESLILLLQPADRLEVLACLSQATRR